LEIHGGPEGEELAAHWRRQGARAGGAPGSATSEVKAADDRKAPPRKRRRRRRRRPANPSAARA
jgi:hypothetical protein